MMNMRGLDDKERVVVKRIIDLVVKLQALHKASISRRDWNNSAIRKSRGAYLRQYENESLNDHVKELKAKRSGLDKAIHAVHVKLLRASELESLYRASSRNAELVTFTLTGLELDYLSLEEEYRKG